MIQVPSLLIAFSNISAVLTREADVTESDGVCDGPPNGLDDGVADGDGLAGAAGAPHAADSIMKSNTKIMAKARFILSPP
jgi:hypothetical protein